MTPIIKSPLTPPHPPGALNYPAVLDTALEIAAAVHHLHGRNVLHSDLKARNIMLKSSGAEGRGASAKVADFGLAVKMDHLETHMSNAFQGTMVSGRRRRLHESQILSSNAWNSVPGLWVWKWGRSAACLP